jgi:hypothetical protein
MGEHHLLTPMNEVSVRAPVAGEVLMANASGRWEPKILGEMSGSFGTPATLTAALTTVTISAPGTPDYAIQDVTNVAPYGFADAEEARSLLSVIRNMQLRLAQVETKLTALGITA